MSREDWKICLGTGAMVAGIAGAMFLHWLVVGY